MGVYIDMEMPKEGFIKILVRDDGTVQQTGQSFRIDGTDYYTPYVGEMPTIYKAVPVQPHGRLGDLDALKAKFKEMGLGDHSLIERLFADGVYAVIDVAPTIIPAEEGET